MDVSKVSPAVICQEEIEIVFELFLYHSLKKGNFNKPCAVCFLKQGIHQQE